MIWNPRPMQSEDTGLCSCSLEAGKLGADNFLTLEHLFCCLHRETDGHERSVPTSGPQAHPRVPISLQVRGTLTAYPSPTPLCHPLLLTFRALPRALVTDINATNKVTNAVAFPEWTLDLFSGG